MERGGEGFVHTQPARSPISTCSPTKPTQFKNRGWAMAMRHWAHPEQGNTQWPIYSLPGPFTYILALFSQKCYSLTALSISFSQLQSFSQTSPISWAHSSFKHSFHRVAGGRESPLLFLRAVTPGSSVHPSHCWPCTKGAAEHSLALLCSQKNNGFN